MGKFISAIAVLAMGAFLASCDLQPKITSIPDSVGDFISSRYPAMLADPNTEPEIYNSAVSDYGVYASPELYGSVDMDEYVNYAGIDDYILKPEQADEVSDKTVDEISDDNAPDDNDEVLDVPDKIGDDEMDSVPDATVAEPEYDVIDVPSYEPGELNVPVRAAVGTVVVRRGDTLYSLAREHNTTIEKLAAANAIKPPYTLRVGQVLKMHPDASKVVSKTETSVAQSEKIQEKVVTKAPKVETKTESKAESKIESKPVTKQEPKSLEKPKLEPKKNEKTVLSQTIDVRVPLQTITVARGDTLYSISRRYEIPVNDLAVMNGLRSPFALGVGQKLRVPNLPETKAVATKPTTQTKPVSKTVTKSEKKVEKTAIKSAQPKETAKTAKTESKPVQKTPQKTQQKSVQKEAPKQSKSKQTAEKVQPIAARSSSKFSWPVRGTILSHYGAKTGGLYNDGINISAVLNATVSAAENGVVAYAGNEVRGMGNLIIIQHADGWMTVYAHLNSMSVRRGARVSVGQKIGTVGQTGKVTSPQLHFEIRKGTKSYNPVNYLKK